jgi:hypothetical protein
MSQRARDEA